IWSDNQSHPSISSHLTSPEDKRHRQQEATQHSPCFEEPRLFSMLRRATTRLFSRPIIAASATTKVRPFASDMPAVQTADEMFVEAWRKVVPNIDPPKTPLSFMQPSPPVPSSIPPKLTFNFYLPYSPELSDKEVDMVIVPATTGQMGILPGHVGTILELKPGVLAVHEGNDVTKYFISGGFAFVHPNSVTDIMALEAVPIDQIDSRLVQKGLTEFTQKLSVASTDYEKAEAQIGVDVYSALNSTLTG
ncbi:hypothetical protein Ancab_037620, partial [Ancistrocladus abbreviatus]